MRRSTVAVLLALLVVVGACDSGRSAAPSAPSSSATPTTATTPAAAASPVKVVFAGDVACEPDRPVTAEQCQHVAVADLAESLAPDLVAIPGDVQYDRGEIGNFRASFDKTWGRFGERMRPAPGNHDYASGGQGYFDYFTSIGVEVGARDEAWYSFEAGGWTLLSLNSNCWVVSCAADGEQARWIEATLAASGTRCALAFWHHPRFTSGARGDTEAVAPLFAALVAGGGDVAVTGHDHFYERFAKLDGDGSASPQGARQFVAGTGGRSLYPALAVRGFSEVLRTGRFGVLELTLEPDSYAWRFVAIGGEVLDQGDEACT